MTSLKSIKNVKNIKDKVVLLRVDLNIPIYKEKILDDNRIKSIKDTVHYLHEQKAKIILISHLGRPKGKRNKTLSLKQIIPKLSDILSINVKFLDSDCASIIKKELSISKIILLENLRFYEAEEKNDLLFAKHLATFADIYVNDAFSVSHRRHASIDSITEFLPSYAGLLMEKEVKNLSNILQQKNITAIIGGAKISTKLTLIQHLLSKVENLVVGGGIANTLLCAKGNNIGQSLCELNMVNTAKHIISNPHNLLLPVDIVTEKNTIKTINQINNNDKILDIGPNTVTKIKEILDRSSTIIWNGPLGFIEYPPFDKSSILIAEYIAKLTINKSITSIAGGGETIAILQKTNSTDKLTYVSTGGGAFLEFIQNPNLPGILPLLTV